MIYYRSITDTVITETSGWGPDGHNKKLGQTRSDNVIKKEMIAMLLAGGQGSRLGVLTAERSKTGSFVWWKVQNHRFSA